MTPNIFASEKLRKLRNRAAHTAKHHEHFLLEHLNEIIEDKFSTFNRKFKKILLIGAISPKFHQYLKNKFQVEVLVIDTACNLLNPNIFPSQEISQTEIPNPCDSDFDLIYSYLDIHHINNIPAYLLKCRELLAKDGFFMASFFGGSTLTELRQSSLQAESEIGGISARIFPFIEVKTAGMLLQKANFSDVASDSDVTSVLYKDITKLYNDLKDIAETNILAKSHKSFMSKKHLELITQKYKTLFKQDNDHTPATFEFIHLFGLK